MSVQVIGGDFGATKILAPLDICPPGRTLLYKRGCAIDKAGDVVEKIGGDLSRLAFMRWP